MLGIYIYIYHAIIQPLPFVCKHPTVWGSPWPFIFPDPSRQAFTHPSRLAGGTKVQLLGNQINRSQVAKCNDGYQMMLKKNLLYDMCI